MSVSLDENPGEVVENPKEMIELDSHPISVVDGFHVERHKGNAGQYIKSIIYGGLDGIVSIFVTVAASTGSDLPIGLVLVFGLAKLIAGAVSMGVGDWLATGAEVDMAVRERKREEWEVDNYIEGEENEMIELYTKKGVDEESAKKIIKILSKYKGAFVDIMMAEELGIPPETVNEVPWKHGVVNFSSFITFGIIPLIVYVIIIGAGKLIHMKSMDIFYISIAVTIATLFGMGVMKGKLTGTPWLMSSVSTILLGGLTAFVGWGIGFVLDTSFPGVAV